MSGRTFFHFFSVLPPLDTGLTIMYLKNKFKNLRVKSISFITCLYKKISENKIDFKIDHIGFKIKNEFVIGYGLDYKQRYRGLKSIYTLDRKKLNEK